MNEVIQKNECRQLNDVGIAEFRQWLTSPGAINEDAPTHLLEEQGTSESVDVGFIPDQNRTFDSRWNFAEYLVAGIGNNPSASLLANVGFWSGLTLLWFDRICPRDEGGQRKVKKHPNYILSEDYRDSYRHALRTSYLLASRYADSAKFLLKKPLHIHGDLTEQLLGTSQHFMHCPCVIETASKLYSADNASGFKKGSTSQKRPGAVRRLVLYFRQLEMTHDLPLLPVDEVVEALPNEYQPWMA